MLQFKVGTQTLLLKPGTEVLIEYLSALADEPMQDDFTVQFDLPIAGNEVLMQYAHEFSIYRRPIEISGTDLIHNGVPINGGRLVYEGSNERDYHVSFVAEAFVSDILDTKLNELDLGAPILTDDMRAYAKLVNTQSYPTAPCCFPMYYAPSFYGRENPYWFPEAQEWKQTQNYVVNDLVTYTDGTPALHTWRYQCIVDSFNDPPSTSPANWRKTAFGIVNHWDHENEEFFQNTGGENFYTLVPWFYTKHILTKALAYYGLRPIGEFMDDPATDTLVHVSNFALDKGGQDKYFHASQVGEETSSGTTLVVRGDDETTAPNTDPDGLWNNTTMRWTCQAAGDYIFRAFVNPVTPLLLAGRTLVVHLVRSSDNAILDTRTFNSLSVIWGGFIGVVTINHTFVTGDIGELYYIRASWSNSAPITLSGCWVEGWRVTTTDSVTFSNTINLREHVPDVTVDEFLSDLRDTFKLRIVPDLRSGTVRFDYVRSVFDTPSTDQTHRLRAPVAINNSQRIKGYEFQPLLEDSDNPDVNKLTYIDAADTYDTLELPTAPGLWTYVKSTRSLYVSVFDVVTGYKWKRQGTWYDLAVIGERANAQQVKSRFGIFPFELISSNGQEFQVPFVDTKGQSRFFVTELTQPPYLIANYLGLRQNASAIICEGGFIVSGAGEEAVNGVYCPDGEENGSPVWTKVGGTRLEDSVYHEDDPNEWWITSGGVPYYVNALGPGFAWNSSGLGTPPVPVILTSGPSYPLASPLAYDTNHVQFGALSLCFDDEESILEHYWRIYAQALIESDLLDLTLEVDAAFLKARDFDRIALILNQRVLFLTMPVTYSTEPGALIAKGTRALRLRNP